LSSGSKSLSATVTIPFVPKKEQGLTLDQMREEEPLAPFDKTDQQLTVANGTNEVTLHEFKVSQYGRAYRLDEYNIQLDKPTTGFNARANPGSTINIRIYSKIDGGTYPGEPLDEETFTQGALTVNVFFRGFVSTRDVKITAQLSAAPTNTIDLPIRGRITKLA